MKGTAGHRARGKASTRDSARDVVANEKNNKFGLLAQLGQTDPASLLQADDPPRPRRPRPGADRPHQPPPHQTHAETSSSVAGRSGGEEDEDEAEDEEGLAQRLDSFLLAHIFSHLHDGPLLARLRLVCERWRGVIDEDRRLWKALLLQDFGWRKGGGRGKGSAKRHKKIEDYRQHYILLHRKRTTAIRDAGAKKRAKLAQVARLLRVLVPQLYDWQQGEHSDMRHPWKMCMHLPEWLQLEDETTVWCGCRACGVRVGIVDVETFRRDYALAQRLTLHCQQNKQRVFAFARCLELSIRSERGVDLEAAAYATYAAFLSGLGALAES